MAKKKTKGKEKAQEISAEMDLGLFTSAEFVDRTAEVPVPDMREFYPPDTKPVIVVRGLTGLELSRVDEEVRVNQEARNEGTIQALTGKAVKALQTLLRTHLDEHTPDQYIKTLYVVAQGMVKPKMDYDQVMKFATTFPIEFRLCFLKINDLTGKGQDFVGKQKGSGETLESSTA